jgi:DNA polymerase III epsilon subunit family exonuclease
MKRRCISVRSRGQAQVMSSRPYEAVAITSSEQGLPGVLCRRGEVPVPSGYAVFDCETTGTDPAVDEIVSLAIVLLDRDGVETGRFSSLVRPSRPIPEDATAVHGIRDVDVVDAPTFDQLAGRLLRLLKGRVFAAHNASFDLAMLHGAFKAAGLEYRPAAVACTLDAFRVLEPLAGDHRLETLCERHDVALDGAHDATGDALAAAALVRVLLERDLAPESARLDLDAFMRLRTRGDTRPASDPQIRRVFALARVAGLTGADGRADRNKVCELVHRVAGIKEPALLTREQVQDVYDELERLIDENDQQAA